MSVHRHIGSLPTSGYYNPVDGLLIRSGVDYVVEDGSNSTQLEIYYRRSAWWWEVWRGGLMLATGAEESDELARAAGMDWMAEHMPAPVAAASTLPTLDRELTKPAGLLLERIAFRDGIQKSVHGKIWLGMGLATDANATAGPRMYTLDRHMHPLQLTGTGCSLFEMMGNEFGEQLHGILNDTGVLLQLIQKHPFCLEHFLNGPSQIVWPVWAVG